MKKCPFCGADLADEAQFCLYCMTPLKEKELITPAKRRPKGWLFVLGGVLLLAVVLLLLWPRTGDATNEPAMQVTTVPTTATTLPTTGTTVPTTVTTVPTTTPSTSSSTTVSTTTKPTTAKPTTTPTTLPTASNEVQYLYRAAKAGDDFSATYQNPGNHIVITGVGFPSLDGIYDIPAMIDGKTVVAIMSNAFFGSGATKIFIPDSIQTIHDHAFNSCALTDVYFRGDAIFCYPNAFPKNFTLHCSAECHDRNLRYYKSSAGNYHATWEEWNGEA